MQTHDFYSNIIFKKYDLGTFQRIGLQLISHVFRVQDELRTPDEVCSAVYGPEDRPEVGGEDECEGMAQMGYVWTDRGERIIDIRQALGVIHLSHVVKMVKPSTPLPPPPILISSSTSNGRSLISRDMNGDSTDSTSDMNVDAQVLHPRAYARQNDDVLRVQVVQFALQLMNEVWRRQWSADPLAAPFVVTVDAVAVSESRGLVQVVSKEGRTIDSTEDPILIDQLVRSTAGAITAAYVLGIHHHELWVKDGYTAFWRSIPRATMPPIPGPASTASNATAFAQLFDTTLHPPNQPMLPRTFRTALKQLHAWDVFRRLCIKAFVSLRIAWQSVFHPVVVPLFVECGIAKKQIENFIQGKNSLFLSEKDDLKSQLYFRRCIS